MIIGIDPGTHCGWAVLDAHGQRVASGAWDLGARRHEGGGMRYLRLQNYLRELFHTFEGKIDAVAYEEVRRHMGTDAAHIYGGVVATLTRICEEIPLPYRGIPVGTVKKFATGKGNAKKDAMLAAAKQRWGVSLGEFAGGEPTYTEDEADALWIASTLHHELSAIRDQARTALTEGGETK